MSKEQREFVERVLDALDDSDVFILEERGSASDRPELDAEIAERRSEFERLFPKESD